MSLPPSLKNKSKGLLKTNHLNMLLRLVLAITLGMVISNLKLDYIEYYLYDIRSRIQPTSEVSGHIEIVFNDSKTIQSLKGEPTFKNYTLLLQKIFSQKPKFLVLNIDTKLIEGTEQDKIEFARMAAKFDNLYVTSEELEMKGEEGKIKLPYPLENISLFSAPKTADSKLFAKDNVTRRMLISYQDKKMMHPFIAEKYNPEIENIENIHGLFELLDSYQAYIHFHPVGSFKNHSFVDILEGKNTDFKNKTIIIGPDNNKSFKDYISTPFSRESIAMTTTEMHANMIESLIENKGPTQSPQWLTAMITVLISILIVHTTLTASPTKGLITLIVTFVAFSSLAMTIFWPFHLWINMANPLLSIFLCYYFFIPYRLIMENRRSWEYYQRNKILQQVEELKTNFISMMSHDLKTPIARIQGMTDVILKDDVSLSNNQREAIDTIKHSSDDLLKFINAILQYGRIESENIHLHLQTKDINKLIQDVIKKHEFLAKLKRIHINAELEPLFPIEIDPDLIKQVISNLIENAIKYSPEETKILITSEESEGKIIIQISDQGLGIPTDEIPNIFMKFFRSKNAKSSPIKGSGLGLYLAKYFTELHNGTISVESIVGQGSTFTVELPMEIRRNSHA